MRIILQMKYIIYYERFDQIFFSTMFECEKYDTLKELIILKMNPLFFFILKISVPTSLMRIKYKFKNSNT